eukprot:jgi/Tetstr1/459896/TSEL_005238.t1
MMETTAPDAPAATPVEAALGAAATGATAEDGDAAVRAKRKCSENTAMDALLAVAEEDKKPAVQVDEGHAGSLLAALSSLRAGSPTSCDLQLTGSDGAGCAVHRCVALALAPGLADKLADGAASASVILPDISGAALTALAGYMYSGELAVTNANAAELLSAARSLRMGGAAELCGRYLKKAISAANVLKRLGIALEADLRELADAALAYIDKRFEQVAVGKDWVGLGADQVGAILRRDTLAAPLEIDAFRALKIWAEAEPEARRDAYLALFADPAVVRLPYLEAEQLDELENDAVLAGNAAAKDMVHMELKRRVLGKPPGVARRAVAAAAAAAPPRKDFLKKKVSKCFDDGNWYHGRIEGTEREEATGLILYQVVYEDGDAEDVYEQEAADLIAAAAKGAGKKASAKKQRK